MFSPRPSLAFRGPLGDLADPAEGQHAQPIALGQLLDVLVGEGHGIAVSLVDGNVALGQRGHDLLAGHGRLDIGGQLFALGPLPLGLALRELRHDLGREELEGLAYVVVAVLAALLDEDGLWSTPASWKVRRAARSSSGVPMQLAPP